MNTFSSSLLLTLLFLSFSVFVRACAWVCMYISIGIGTGKKTIAQLKHTVRGVAKILAVPLLFIAGMPPFT